MASLVGRQLFSFFILSLRSFLGMTLAATVAEYLGWSMAMSLYSITSAVFLAMVVTIKIIESIRCCLGAPNKQNPSCVENAESERENLLPTKATKHYVQK